MRIVVLGSGGREHALFLKLKESDQTEKIYFAPGNGGIDNEEKFDVDVMDFASLEKNLRDRDIGLLVVGPEGPLAGGIKNHFAKEMPELLVFGPDANGAQLEASKTFSYTFMEEQSIPQAKSRVAENLESALAILNEHPLPVVIKADGLAAGKGVSIHTDKTEAKEKLAEIFNENIFGDAGSSVLFQEFMEGKEASLFAICNGESAIYLPTACDYKRAFDGQEGPNTGGMGSFSPGNILTEKMIAYVDTHIVQKVVNKFSYTGILYVGLMIHNTESKENSENKTPLSVVEFNCRLGDPETQSVMPMLETDLLPYILWACGKEKDVFRIKENAEESKEENSYYTIPQKPGYTINVVLSAKGYPLAYEKNINLGLPEEMPEGLHIVHAGTKRNAEDLLSSGGRIMNIVGYDKDPGVARKKVYDFIETLKNTIDFSKIHYRTDIGL